jgi:DNA ligase (NAD+)
MSDREYDALYDELCTLEAEIGIVLSNSPTQRVGYQVLSNLTKIKHPTRMLSLNKTKQVTELAEFLGNKEGMLSYKMDGLTVVLTYRAGELVQAVTRGNGEIGEDITHNARVFKNIPIKLSFKGELIVRGEAVISFSDFNAINDRLEAEQKYKNPRNLCSGTVRQLNSEICAGRNVCFIAFGMVSGEGLGSFKLKSEELAALDSLGFDSVDRVLVTADTVAQAVADFESKIPDNLFATDGLVMTYNDIAYSNSLGQTAKFPRDSIAFKWADEQAETTLTAIDWSTARTGLITPVAVFEPVELEGTTVERASVHNVSIVEELELGIGDRITVYKANMIIPQIADNLTRSGTADIPKFCPVCGEATELIAQRDGKALKCVNPNCMAQRVQTLEHYVSRDAMNIEGMSEATIERFIEASLLDNYTDIYKLSNHKDEIVNMDGFGEKSFNKLVEAIEHSRECELSAFIYALGINNVGLSNAKLLCKHFDDDIDNILNATEEELVDIEGFGSVIASSIVKYFSYEENTELIKTALGYLNIIRAENTNKQIFEGMTFVVTGDVHHFKNRKELQAEVEARGGKVSGSVSSKTAYLVNNDINSVSSKNKKAKELGVPIITEDEFIDMLNK